MMALKVTNLVLVLMNLCNITVNADEEFHCGAHEPTEHEIEQTETQINDFLLQIDDEESLSRSQTIIDVVWHVIHNGTEGMLTRNDLDFSMEELNRDFADSGSTFQFQLVDVTYTDNSNWFMANVEVDYEFFEMHNSLAKGDCTTVNVFSTGLPAIGGFGTFPLGVNCQRNVPDGIWIRHNHLPGKQFSFSKALTHEAGHWLGLYHTFAGGCNGIGDLVGDTPAQRTKTQGCNAIDTCSGEEISDPIHNYMDYSSCATEFTRGQIRRMLLSYHALRAMGGMSQLITSNGSCFSPNATATVKDKGKIAMKNISVGDEVLTASGNYQTVYTINHFHPTKTTDFVQIHTDLVSNGKENALEVSPMHLVYVEGQEHPVPAIDVRVGDFLLTLNDGPQKVNAIHYITRNGLYNPITTDGTIIVDGVIASSYTSFTGSAHVEIAGMKLISVHKLLNMTIAPYRAFCTTTSRLNICNQHEEGELPVAVQLLSRFYDCFSEWSTPVQVVILSLYLSFFFVINFFLNGCFSAAAVVFLILFFVSKSTKILSTFFSVFASAQQNKNDVKTDLKYGTQPMLSP